MSQPLPDAEVLAAARDPNATTATLAREVAQARGLSIPLRITSVSAPTAADAPDYGPTGWSRHDDEHDGTTWYVRLPVEIHHDWPAAAVPASVPARNYAPLTPARNYELVRDEVVADVVLSMSRTVDHGEAKHEVEYITILACERVVVIDAREWDAPSRRWVTVSTETTRTPIDVAEVDRALSLWAERHRRVNRIDLLAIELRDSAVEIVETDSLHDAEVTL